MNYIRAALSPSEASTEGPDLLFCHDPSYLPHTADSAEAWMSRCR